MTSSENKNQYLLGVIYAATAGIMWAVLAIAMKVVVRFMDGVTVSWFRFAFSFVVLAAYLALKKPDVLSVLIKPPAKAALAAFFLLGNYIFYINGVRLTTPSLAQVMIQLAPLSLVFIGVLVFKEKLSWRQIMGMAISCIGFYFFYSDQLETLLNADLGPDFKLGAILVVIAALSWALYGAFQKVLLRKYTSNHINLLIYGFPTIFMLPWVNFSGFFGLEFWQWSLMVFLGLNTIIAYGAVSEAFRLLPTSQVSMIITLNPILTILIMTALYYMEVSWIHAEKIKPLGFLGAMLVVGGALVVLYKPGPKRLN